MVGDRLSTDIAMAATAGMDSALVLTGETTPEMAGRLPQDGAPTWILDRIDHLLPATEGDVDGRASMRMPKQTDSIVRRWSADRLDPRCVLDRVDNDSYFTAPKLAWFGPSFSAFRCCARTSSNAPRSDRLPASAGVGRWRVPDDIERSWTVDRVFEPAMDGTMRDALYGGWYDAVRTSAPRPAEHLTAL